MNSKVPFPRAGGDWRHDAKTGALVPAAVPPSVVPRVPAPPAPVARAASAPLRMPRNPTRRSRASYE